MSSVTFANFGRCSTREDRVLMTKSSSHDANHPVHLSNVADHRYETGGKEIEPRYKVFVHPPSLGKVNPADCVDMDCDGLKHVIIRDLDGSFTE